MITKPLHPDAIEKVYLRGRGEFSLHSNNSFQRHLQKLHQAVSNIKMHIRTGNITKNKMRNLFREVHRSNPLWY